MQFIKGHVGIGAAERDAMALGCKDGVIEVFLSSGEGA